MPLIVNPSAAYNWSLTRERICDKALEKCGRLGIGRPVNNDDRNLSLEALDSVLKNLLWYGLSWPKTASGVTTLAFTAGLASLALPADYYSDAMVNYIAVTKEIGLRLIGLEEWKRIPDKTVQATYPRIGYIDNFNVLHLSPVPSAALNLDLYYQQVILNSVAGASVDLDSPWLLGLVYGVAAEIGDEFGIDPKKIARFEAKWAQQRTLGIMNECPPGPDRVTVAD